MKKYENKFFTHMIMSIGDLPVGAGVAMATPDKERNLSTRNQNIMNKGGEETNIFSSD